MAAIDGTIERLSADPVPGIGSLTSLLPSIALHGAVAAAIWLGVASQPQDIQPPVTFIALAPAAPEPLPLPPTGLRLPQSAAPAADAPPLDFAPPPLPETEGFPFDPAATRAAPQPEPQDAAPIEKKAAEKPKPKPDKPKPDKPKQAKAKPAEKTKPKAAAKPAAPLAPAASKPAELPKATPAAASATATPAAAAPAKPVTDPAQSAAVSDAPVRVTNPAYAGACPISYPERARKRNQQGTVVVHALIGRDGRPIEVTVAASSGHRLLDEAARDAIAGCAFVPQKVGGRAVKAIVEIPIPFKLI